MDPDVPGAEAAAKLLKLEARVRRLADEKSSLQLVLRLMERLQPQPGIDAMIAAVLGGIVETIGGTGIVLYYWIDGRLHRAGLDGEPRQIPEIDDPLVADVAAQPRFVERTNAAANALLTAGAGPGAWTWLCPLVVGNDLVGVIRLDNIHVSSASLPNYLPVFFHHAALMIGGSIRDHLHRQAEAALRRNEAANLELHRRVEERERLNRALESEREEQRALIHQLAEARNQLLESERLAAVGQLAAGVAHEINNPVAFVNANLGCLRRYLDGMFRMLDDYGRIEEAAPPDARERIAATRRQVDADSIIREAPALIAESIDGLRRIRGIIQDLRDFCRPDDTEWREVDLHANLDRTLNLLAGEFRSGIEVVRDYANLPLVECQPSRINQVFVNLLVNAAQSIEDRGQVIVRTRCVGQEVSIAIADSGRGIAAAARARIFDPFYTTRPPGTGRGLGLSVAYGIVSQHGGRIDVTSEVGVGSTFTIWLPLRQPGAAGTGAGIAGACPTS